MARIAIGVGLVSLASGCAAIDAVGVRGAAMDESIAQYRSEETLRNIVRGSKEEPLNFSAFSTVTGHNTVTAGVPALTWGAPSRAPSEAIGSTTANTIAYNFSNDFTFNQIDDNATISAMLTPLDASTMAIFFEYGYPPDLLLLLFIHRLQIREGKNGGPWSSGKVLHIFYSNRIGDISSEDEGRRLEAESTLRAYSYLVDYQGLTFRFERATIPGQQKKPRSQLCFDPDTAFVNNIPKIDELAGLSGKVRRNGHLTTILDELLRTYSPARKPPGASVSKTPGIDVLNIANCNESKTWIPSSDSASATTENINCISSICSSKKKQSEPEVVYRIYDPYDDLWLELFPRSTYSIYRFLGGLINTNVPLMLGGLGEDPFLFNVVTDRGDDCFAQIAARQRYCVPRAANNTKGIFAILHQLAALYTFPNTAPANASTVRITP